MKLHLIWDMDGTLVDSEGEVFHTIEKSLEKVGLSIDEAQKPLRIGPPVRDVIRNSYSEDLLNNDQLDVVVGAFREIYDASEFEDTIPFEGIEELILCNDLFYKF